MMIAQILAQSVDNVPAEFLKNAVLVIVALCVGAGGWAAWADHREKKRQAAQRRAYRETGGQSGRMPNVRADFCKMSMDTVNERLDAQAAMIENLREEDKEIRERLSQAIRDFEGATERIAGTLGEIKTTTDALLAKAIE